MLYLSAFIILSIFIYLYKKQKEIIKYIPITKKGIVNLYEIINKSDTYISFYKLYFNMAIMFAFTLLMAFTLKLNLMFTITLFIISLIVMPLITLWKLTYYREAYEFNNLVTYLNQFMMVFKSYPKVYATLIEIENTISGNLKILVNDSIEEIKNGQSSQRALENITKAYPHFIVYNLHSLVFSIEQYGSRDYFEAIDLIQDDLDDWLEDILAYQFEKNKIIRKVLILICFAFIICFIALKMLFVVEVQVTSTIYQVSMFIFCLLLIFTYLAATSVLNADWIERSEII